MWWLYLSQHVISHKNFSCWGIFEKIDNAQSAKRVIYLLCYTDVKQNYIQPTEFTGDPAINP